MSCEYEECGKKTFAVEGITGTKMELCSDHFQNLFGKFMKNLTFEEIEFCEKHSIEDSDEELESCPHCVIKGVEV